MISQAENDALICDKILPVPEIGTGLYQKPEPTGKKMRRGLYLRLPDDSCREYVRAMQVVDVFDGPEHLYIKFTKSGTIVMDPGARRVDPAPVMLQELCRRIGSENVVFVE